MANPESVLSFEDNELSKTHSYVTADPIAAACKTELQVFWYGDCKITGDQTTLMKQILSSLTSLERVFLRGETSELFLVVLESLVLHNRKLKAMDIGELNWGFFERLGGFRQVFVSLEFLGIRFGDDYDAPTPEGIAGLRTVLGWAPNLVELKCAMYWGVSWDEVAGESSWPNLKSLTLGSCKSSKRFLQSFFEEHVLVKSFYLEGYVTKDKDDDESINFPTAIEFFSSTTFNGVNGAISEGKYSEWGGVKLELKDDYIHIVGPNRRVRERRKRETI